MATNPNMAGDGTALYISSVLKPTGVKITRLARGLPTGTTIEFANARNLTDAITGREESQYNPLPAASYPKTAFAKNVHDVTCASDMFPQ